MSTIDFNGEAYPIRDIQMPFGLRTVAVSKLNDALVNAEGTYSTNDAIKVDEKIFFFLNEDEFNLSEMEIVKTILESL